MLQYGSRWFLPTTQVDDIVPYLSFYVKSKRIVHVERMDE